MPQRGQPKKKSSSPKGQWTGDTTATERQSGPQSPAGITTVGGVVDELLAKRARARLAALDAVNSSFVKRRLRSGSARRRDAAARLLEGKVAPPSKLVKTARGGVNPFHVAMKAGLGRKRKPKAAKKAKRAADGAAAKAKGGKGSKRRVAALALHTKRPTVSASSSPSSSKTRAGPTLALAARFADIRSSSSSSPREASGKARGPSTEEKAVRRGEPRRKKERKEQAVPAGSAAPQPRWARQCTASTVRSLHNRTTRATHLSRLWGAAKAAGRRGRRQRKYLLHRALGMTRLPPPFRRGTKRSALLRVVRTAHKMANADVWDLARTIVVRRRWFVCRLNSLVAPSGPVRTEERGGSSCPAGGTRLSCARSFPLFGVFVDILWLRFSHAQQGRGGGRVKACTSLVRQRTGVVLTESARRVTALVLPREKDRSQYKAVRVFLGSGGSSSAADPPPPTLEPRVVSIRKWFPGASGTAAELRARVRPSRPRTTSWVVPVAVVRGESLDEERGSRPHHRPLDGLCGRCL